MTHARMKNSTNQIVVTVARQLLSVKEIFPALTRKSLTKQKLNFPIVAPLVPQFN
jgi:hypothetical protein